MPLCRASYGTPRLSPRARRRRCNAAAARGAAATRVPPSRGALRRSRRVARARIAYGLTAPVAVLGLMVGVAGWPVWTVAVAAS